MLLTLALAAAGTGGPAEAADAPMKAAIVYNISRFSAWAPARFGTPSDPIVLCVEPGDPLSGALLGMSGKPVGDRRLAVRTETWPFGADCHMAFVSAARADPAALRALAARGVLTIGEGSGFAQAGAVQLLTVGQQVRFEINNKTARRAGATLSSQLLRLAVKVR